MLGSNRPPLKNNTFAFKQRLAVEFSWLKSTVQRDNNVRTKKP